MDGTRSPSKDEARWDSGVSKRVSIKRCYCPVPVHVVAVVVVAVVEVEVVEVMDVK